MIRHSEGHSSSVRTKRKVGAKSYQSKKASGISGNCPRPYCRWALSPLAGRNPPSDNCRRYWRSASQVVHRVRRLGGRLSAPSLQRLMTWLTMTACLRHGLARLTNSTGWLLAQLALTAVRRRTLSMVRKQLRLKRIVS
jgi:hypothetical protein